MLNKSIRVSSTARNSRVEFHQTVQEGLLTIANFPKHDNVYGEVRRPERVMTFSFRPLPLFPGKPAKADKQTNSPTPKRPKKTQAHTQTHRHTQEPPLPPQKTPNITRLSPAGGPAAESPTWPPHEALRGHASLQPAGYYYYRQTTKSPPQHRGQHFSLRRRRQKQGFS